VRGDVVVVTECGSYLHIDHRGVAESCCHRTEIEFYLVNVDRSASWGKDAMRRSTHPTDAQGRTWTTDDLEEILRGEDYDWDEAAALLRDSTRPYLSDALALLEEWADRIRAILDQARAVTPSQSGSAQD
jgi:hypothetical protein